MSTPQLDPRSKAILLEVVREYIDKGEPIGSRSISKKHFENLSPATIRNVMADLEEMGFLNHPHPSAGRVPTDLGYRYLVDTIINDVVAPKDLRLWGDRYDLELKNQNLQEVLEQTCASLSNYSNQTGLVMLPSFSNMVLKHIDFIKVGRSEALAVFFSEQGVLQNKVIAIDKDTPQEELTSISNYLNAEFSNKSIKTIRKELLDRIHFEKEHFDRLQKKALELSNEFFSDEPEKIDLLVDGAHNLLNHPEFTADLDKMRSILKTVEEKKKLITLLDRCLKQDGMTILIGEESHDEEMQDFSLVAENYQYQSENIGTVAIFGPKRMDYTLMISIVNYTANTVSKILSERMQGK